MLTKTSKIVVLFLLTSLLLLSAAASVVPNAKAAATDTVVVYSSIGGTTSPDAGTYTYDDGSTQTFAATAGEGFIFQNWEIATAAGAYSDTDNPFSLTLNESAYAIQANFVTINFAGTGVTSNMASLAVVVVLGAVGGTVSPVPGTYAVANATSFNLMATPASGWTFSHWVIGGSPMTHGAYSFTDTPTDNPYNVDHGYGYTYSYQPVFAPVSPATSPTPTPKVPEFSSVAAILVAAILVIVAFGTYAYTKKTRN